MYDYHSHTDFSDDCPIPMEDMIRGAIAKGVKELAITDHYDPGYNDPDFPFSLDFESYHQALLEAEAHWEKKIKIVKGLELGIMEGQLEESSRVVRSFPYDFVIGSFHSFGPDSLYTFDYSSMEASALVEGFYTYVLRCLKQFKDYDIVGHLSILDRYTRTLLDYTPYWDILDDILKTVIHDGKGLEINTSTFKYRMSVWLPREEILRRYRELGGEILTFGSDSHSPEFFLDHFAEAKDFARSLGFRYFSRFEKRKVSFLPL